MKSEPRTDEEIRAALQGGIARRSAASFEEIGGGERLLAASFRAAETARALQRKLTAAGVPSEMKKSRARFEVRIDAGDRTTAGPLVDAFRDQRGDPPPVGSNHHDLLILSSLTASVLGLAVSYELTLRGSLPVVVAMTGAGALLGFTADYVIARAKRDRLRFGIVEMMLLTAIVGTLLMIARQLPQWLGLP